MLKIFRVMLWEQWRISRMELLLRSSVLLACIALVAALGNKLDESALPVLRGIFVFLIGFAALFSASWTQDLDSRQLGFTYALGFTRPVATRWLVLVPILYSLALSQVFYLGCALAIFWVQGMSLPLLGPAAIIACTVCLLVAGAWSSTRIDGRITGMVGAILITFSWLALRDYLRNDPEPVLLAIGRDGYFDLAWLEYLGLFAVSSLAIAFTIQSVDWQRHGESVWCNTLRLRSANDLAPAGRPPAMDAPEPTDGADSIVRPTARTLSFRNSVAAQVWYELRRSAPLCLTASLILLPTFFAFLCVNLHWELAPRAWMGAMVLIPVIFQFLAADSTMGITSKHGVVRLSPFDATRPMRCDQLIAIKLMVVFGWSVSGFALVALLAGLYALLSGEYEYWLRDFRAINVAVGDVWPGWWLVAAVNFLLAFLASTNLLFTQGLFFSRYPKVIMVGSLLVLVHVGIFAWDAAHDWAWLVLWKTYGVVVPLAMMLVSVIAIVAAIRAGYLSQRYFATVFGVWLIYALAAIWLVSTSTPPVPIPLFAYLIGVALLLVTLASAAFAPLALAAHRHA